MAKKKNQTKKHKFKYVAPPAGAGTVSAGATAAPSSDVVKNESSAVVRRGAVQRGPVLVTAGARDFSYVQVDLQRIAVLAVSLVVVEIALWFLFEHTGVGNAVYQLVQV